jgi:hypothetical protein
MDPAKEAEGEARQPRKSTIRGRPQWLYKLRTISADRGGTCLLMELLL